MHRVTACYHRSRQDRAIYQPLSCCSVRETSSDASSVLACGPLILCRLQIANDIESPGEIEDDVPVAFKRETDAENVDNSIDIQFKGADGYIVWFKVKPTTSFGKIMDTYAAHAGLEVQIFRFYWEGQRLYTHDTAATVRYLRTTGSQCTDNGSLRCRLARLSTSFRRKEVLEATSMRHRIIKHSRGKLKAPNSRRQRQAGRHSTVMEGTMTSRACGYWCRKTEAKEVAKAVRTRVVSL